MRFVELLGAIRNASRDTLSETLDDLQANGIVVHQRYGTTARYHLTTAGARLGDVCRQATHEIGDSVLLPIALKKWPMLVLVAIARGNTRFNRMKAVLTGITAGALAPALRDLQGAGLVQRTTDESYVLTERGGALLPTIAALVEAAEHLSPTPGAAAD
jgi:DNA-binding HxlR family transcriptional regulator